MNARKSEDVQLPYLGTFSKAAEANSFTKAAKALRLKGFRQSTQLDKPVSVGGIELPAALAVVRDLPSIRFVIDHIAKPPIATGAIDQWAARLKPLAASPNVFCKLSGMVTEADWKRWTARDLAPYASRVLEWFGPERCVFGSDWPVCLVAASYAHVIDACGVAIGDVPSAERERIFGGNAIELYRLPVPATAERRS